jgi:hypothetical protein
VDGANELLLPAEPVMGEVIVGTRPYFFNRGASPDITLSAASLGVSCPPSTALQVWPMRSCTPATLFGGTAAAG